MPARPPRLLSCAESGPAPGMTQDSQRFYRIASVDAGAPGCIGLDDSPPSAPDDSDIKGDGAWRMNPRILEDARSEFERRGILLGERGVLGFRLEFTIPEIDRRRRYPPVEREASELHFPLDGLRDENRHGWWELRWEVFRRVDPGRKALVVGRFHEGRPGPAPCFHKRRELDRPVSILCRKSRKPIVREFVEENSKFRCDGAREEGFHVDDRLFESAQLRWHAPALQARHVPAQVQRGSPEALRIPCVSIREDEGRVFARGADRSAGRVAAKRGAGKNEGPGSGCFRALPRRQAGGGRGQRPSIPQPLGPDRAPPRNGARPATREPSAGVPSHPSGRRSPPFKNGPCFAQWVTFDTPRLRRANGSRATPPPGRPSGGCPRTGRSRNGPDGRCPRS